MAGRAPKLDSVLASFLGSVDSAASLASAVQSIAVVRPLPGTPSLHVKQARRAVELAFLGLVANWEEFLEQSFVRYLAGAKSKVGGSPPLRLGKASGISHAYHVLSGDPGYDPARNYSKFGEPKWVIDTARIYFETGAPYATRMTAYLEALQAAVKMRNRVAHNSEKCREDFKKIARTHLAISPTAKLTQGFSVGDLLMKKPVAIFSNKVKARYSTYFDAYCGLYRYLALNIARYK